MDQSKGDVHFKNMFNFNYESEQQPAEIKMPKEIDDNEEEEQDDLTNLAWLTELRNQRHKYSWQNSICYNGLDKAVTGEDDFETINEFDAINTTQITAAPTNATKTNEMPKNSTNPQQQQTRLNEGNQHKLNTIKRPTPMERFEIFCRKVKRDLAEYDKNAIEYQTIETEKPPFNYSHIIGMVMLEKGRVTLQQICAWIELKFAYFRARKKWNNSIRHNLSLHPCFRKIDRKKYEKGKGGYWELGIDLKKCERKRIRHRKNAHKQQQLKEQQTAEEEIKASEEDIQAIDEDGELHTEFVLDDEFDVQQNLDIACCTFEQQQQPQAYQLGTIIISGSSFVSNNLMETTTACSSGIAASHSIISPLEPNWPLYQEVTTSTTASTTNDDINDNFHLLQQQHVKTPNVIVEELQQGQHNITSPTNSFSNINTNNDLFQPEIDSIEEAFQYLRSLDTNNREDNILDNFFDVSVSDF